MHDEPTFSEAWRQWRRRVDLDEYHARWDRMQADGTSVHDEAHFVAGLDGRLILDAGCGTGRVAAELSRRGRQVVGVDNDSEMLAYADRRPEPIRWQLGDLSSITLPEIFDIAVMAGNILLFVQPEQRGAVVANVARHLKPGGPLVIGSSRQDGCSFADTDRWCRDVGLETVEQHATWDRRPFEDGDYRVSVHRRTL